MPYDFTTRSIVCEVLIEIEYSMVFKSLKNKSKIILLEAIVISTFLFIFRLKTLHQTEILCINFICSRCGYEIGIIMLSLLLP